MDMHTSALYVKAPSSRGWEVQQSMRSAAIADPDSFLHWSRTWLNELIPHHMSAFGLTTKHTLGVRPLETFTFRVPEAYLQQVTRNPGVGCPVFFALDPGAYPSVFLPGRGRRERSIGVAIQAIRAWQSFSPRTRRCGPWAGVLFRAVRRGYGAPRSPRAPCRGGCPRGPRSARQDSPPESEWQSCERGRTIPHQGGASGLPLAPPRQDQLGNRTHPQQERVDGKDPGSTHPAQTGCQEPAGGDIPLRGCFQMKRSGSG